MKHTDFIRYPLGEPRSMRLERWIVKRGYSWPIKCTVCGALARTKVESSNLRETCSCARCSATNRQRQIAYVICGALSTERKLRIRSLHDVAQLGDLTVYNTESRGAIHDHLARMPHYLCSEYLGPEQRSGDIVNGIVHQDLMALSFDDASIDLAISSDVFEHVPDPYQGHREINRVLRRGGRHVFTVPFHPTEFLDDQRASLDSSGANVYHKEPIYHGDPIHPEGALVYTIFSLQMLVRLREIGFRTNFYHLYRRRNGILGHNALVFEAIKE